MRDEKTAELEEAYQLDQVTDPEEALALKEQIRQEAARYAGDLQRAGYNVDFSTPVASADLYLEELDAYQKSLENLPKEVRTYAEAENTTPSGLLSVKG